MRLKIVEVSLLAPEKERDAIVGARDHQLRLAGGQSGNPVIAKPIAQEHRVVTRAFDPIDRRLQAVQHDLGADIMQALGEKLHLDGVHRSRNRGAELAIEDLATDQFQAHGMARDSRWRTRLNAAMKAGVVPQQPPMNATPASAKPDALSAKASAVVL